MPDALDGGHGFRVFADAKIIGGKSHENDWHGNFNIAGTSAHMNQPKEQLDGPARNVDLFPD